MVADTTVRARLDSETKERATKVLESVGLNASDLIRLTFRKVAAEGRLPFVVDVPNATTLGALDELDQGHGARFTSVEELMADLEP